MKICRKGNIAWPQLIPSSYSIPGSSFELEAAFSIVGPLYCSYLALFSGKQHLRNAHTTHDRVAQFNRASFHYGNPNTIASYLGGKWSWLWFG